MRRARLATALFLLLVLVAAIPLAPGGAARYPAHGRAANRLRPLGALAPAQHVAFGLVLRTPNPLRLERSVAALEDPGSPSFRHLIAPSSFGERFGISRLRLMALERALTAAGVHVIAAYPQRTELAVDGTVAAVDRVLAVHLVGYADAAGHRYSAPSDVPMIPHALAGAVQAITGLDTRPQWLAHDVPLGGLTPTVAASAYDLAPLHRLGFYGQGQTIAVISFSAFDPRDPASYARDYSLSGPAPQVVSVEGGTRDLSGQDEANLDIDIIRAVAPAARILIYESSSSYSAMINRIVADRSAQVISSSWGQCELGLDPSERVADSQALAAAVAGGVSTFVATGDNGAYDCQGSDTADHRLSVDWPAASADAVAVGGTRLYLAPNGSYLGETAWEDQLSALGGGGGFTTGDQRPPWQAGPGVLGPGSTGRRQLPDVSANADPGTPWSFYSGGRLNPDGAGTSASAPFWAAATILVEQYAASRGVHGIGYINPILYALAASPQRYAPFHDVTRGGNRYYAASPGWDPATGLGSPDVYNLARDVVSYLRRHT